MKLDAHAKALLAIAKRGKIVTMPDRSLLIVIDRGRRKRRRLAREGGRRQAKSVPDQVQWVIAPPPKPIEITLEEPKPFEWKWHSRWMYL